MAYDRYDTRAGRRDESRWPEGRENDRDYDRGRRDERGFFERAGDEIASWFGDDDTDRRRRSDQMRDEREGRTRDPYRERSWNRDREYGRDQDRNWNDNRGVFARGGSSESDYNSSWRRELTGNRGRGEDRLRSYRPVTGDYGRAEQDFDRGGYGPAEQDRFSRDRLDTPWGRDEYRRTSRAGTSDWSDRSRHEDPHYESWRRRHMAELDRDYDDYRSENQDRFEKDFGTWRSRRMTKRGLMSQIREHMEVVGSDDQHVGTVDRIAGDRIILAKSDPESGGSHHSLSCAEIDRIDGERVILDCTAQQAVDRWRDETRGRALFERESQGEMGPRMLDRSFEGTYRK